MVRFKQKKMISMLVAVGAVASIIIAGSAMAGDMDNRYAVDSAKGVVKNIAGECWVTVGGMQGRLAECGDVIDSDGDGVFDDKDKCPNTPEGVKVDADGCALDSDGDGVADYKDKCPNTPAGAPVDANGCPLDSDGDGVPDYKDKCPGTPAGAKVDMNGCQIMGNITIDLVNDEFDFDSAALKPSMKSALDGVAAKIKASAGDESLMVIGHTDSKGSDAYNQGLSERRASAVAGYLATKGISPAKMTTKGMGESQPVADNGTDAGRAKNRRVEITTK
ncbi:MAG: flagellar motor protein MotB [Sedimenticola sp.]|nr:MAG: flagellar motor protein MotB [Sedimenticola sp.]